MLLILRFKIVFHKERRLEKLCNRYAKALAQLVNDTELHRGVGAIQEVSDGGFGNTAFQIKLIGGHLVLLQQLRQPFAYRFIQLHSITTRS